MQNTIDSSGSPSPKDRAWNTDKAIAPSPDIVIFHARWLGFLVLASGLHIFEAALPALGPWFKLGLANIITLLVLILMGVRAALWLALARVIIGAFMIGTLFSPTFVMSLAGTLAATTVMILSWRYISGITLIGVSLLAALAHMLTQFLVVEYVFIQQAALFYLLSPLLLLSCATGWLNGALASYIVTFMNPNAKDRNPPPLKPLQHNLKNRH